MGTCYIENRSYSEARVTVIRAWKLPYIRETARSGQSFTRTRARPRKERVALIRINGSAGVVFIPAVLNDACARLILATAFTRNCFLPGHISLPANQICISSDLPISLTRRLHLGLATTAMYIRAVRGERKESYHERGVRKVPRILRVDDGSPDTRTLAS